VTVILTHENCDFDALAASVAAAKLYPGSFIIMPGSLQPNVRSFVNLYRDILPLKKIHEVEAAETNTIIVVDTNRKERLGRSVSLLEQAEEITVYDHHPGDEDIGANGTFIEQVGATTTILLEEIKEKQVELTEFEATLFALGIYEDTGCLTYDISTARDARILAFLWERGINLKLVQEYLRASLNEAQKNVLEKLISNSELFELNQRRVLISTAEFDHYIAGAAVLIQMLNELENAALTVVIIKMSESIYLAARSGERDLDLLELLAPFDVKGYPSAVSAIVKGSETHDLKSKIIELLSYYLPPVLNAVKAASKPVFTVGSETSLTEADVVLNRNGFKGCPVTENEKIVGIISRRDLQKGLRNKLEHAPVKGFMTKKVITAAPETPLSEIRRLMVENNIGRVPLIDRNNKLAGIITRTDILRYWNDLDSTGRTVMTGDKPLYLQGLPQNGLVNSSIENSESLPSSAKKLLFKISEVAERESVELYLVGGTIRDLLLKYPLEKDFDFVVVGDAVKFAVKLQKLLGGKIRHFEQFGTASLDLQDSLRLDFVTARKEFYASPAALPQVESSSLKNDLFRRDFTINTMACSLSGKNYGKIYDYFKGQSDLKKKVIRALYKLSFVDDPLRILRAVRFEQRYSFSIEPETLEMIKNAVDRKILEKVSRQRLNQELKLIYSEPSPLKILIRFDQLGIIDYLYPRVSLNKSTVQLLKNIEEILIWAGSREWEKDPDPELIYVAGLLFNLDYADQSAIIRKLSLSKERASVILESIREVPVVLKKLDLPDINPSLVVRSLENLTTEAILFTYTLTDKKIVRDHLKLYMDKLRYITPSLTGADLKNMGLEQGPLYRKIIGSLKQAVLDGEVHTIEEEHNYVTKYLEAEKREEK
jgi:tRNA nucleotidyltransferase (CCA-adding enzyme)